MVIEFGDDDVGDGGGVAGEGVDLPVSEVNDLLHLTILRLPDRDPCRRDQLDDLPLCRGVAELQGDFILAPLILNSVHDPGVRDTDGPVVYEDICIGRKDEVGPPGLPRLVFLPWSDFLRLAVFLDRVGVADHDLKLREQPLYGFR